MRKYDCVIWDWNGTLIDDAHIACAAVNDILNDLGRKNIDMDEYYHLMRDGMDHYYDYLFYPDKAPFDKLVVWFSNYYDARICSASLQTGAKEVLRRLKDIGITQAIVSSSHKEKVRRDAAVFGIDTYFDEILGADDLMIGSKTERARQYLDRKGISPDRTLLVGDMTHDKDTAKGIGADYAVIPKGHQSAALLESKGINLISDVFEVVNLVS